jgi:hypothetical protein
MDQKLQRLVQLYNEADEYLRKMRTESAEKDQAAARAASVAHYGKEALTQAEAKMRQAENDLADYRRGG